MEPAVDEALRTLFDYAGRPEWAEELAQARKEFFALVGAPLPGEALEELRLASLVEWFIFDRRLAGPDCTPVEEYVRLHASELSGDVVAVFQGFPRAVHSVFEVKKRTERGTYLLDLYSGVKYKEARRVPMTLGKRDMVELRLVPVNNQWFATDGLCVHPYLARKAITRRLKEARKKGQPLDPLLWKLMAMNTKFERAPRTAKAHIYQFS